MPVTETDRVSQLVVDGFKALGLTESEPITRMILLRELTFVGQRFQCGEMQAVWSAGERRLAFYDSRGKLLGTTSLEMQPMNKAA